MQCTYDWWCCPREVSLVVLATYDGPVRIEDVIWRTSRAKKRLRNLCNTITSPARSRDLPLTFRNTVNAPCKLYRYRGIAEHVLVACIYDTASLVEHFAMGSRRLRRLRVGVNSSSSSSSSSNSSSVWRQRNLHISNNLCTSMDGSPL